eukprot:5670576-Ditylum_brightwellii.AAC.1
MDEVLPPLFLVVISEMRYRYLGGIVPRMERAWSMPCSCWRCCSISVSSGILEQLKEAKSKGGDLVGGACGNDH